MSARATLGKIRNSGVVGIVRARSSQVALEQGRAVLAAGLEVVEISLVTPGALTAIDALAEVEHGAVVGAGTVLDARAAREAIAAGAQILVCPNLEPTVIEVAVAADVAVVPGCLTPTEMTTAIGLGATAVKVFPAHTWSPPALAGLLQALPGLPCIPTGGVGPADAAGWIAAGAVAVGVGAALTASADPVAAVSDLRSSIARVRVDHA